MGIKINRFRSYETVLVKLLSILGIILSFLLRAEYTAYTIELICVNMVIILSLITCIYVRKNVLLLTIALIMLWSNLSAMTANYSVSYSQVYPYVCMYQNTDIATEGTFVLLLFISIMNLFLPANIDSVKDFNYSGRYRGRYSTLIVVSIFILLAINWFLNSSGFKNVGGRGVSNRFFEYSYILFIVGYYFAGDDGFLQKLLTSMVVVYFLQCIVAGNRAAIIGDILLLFALFYAYKCSIIQVILVFSLGSLFFIAQGMFREKLIFNLGNIFEVARKLSSGQFVFTTAAAAYHQGLAYIRLLRTVSFGERLYFAKQWFTYIVVGSSVPDCNLSMYCQKLYPGMGGGFIPFYFYFYFGITGIILIGIMVSQSLSLINNLSANMDDSVVMIGLSIFVTTCRWYLYSPSSLTRGILIMLFVGKTCLLIARMLGSDTRYHTKGDSR